MLVQFMLKNVLSFKDETILDMTAVNAYKEHASNMVDIGNKEKFLKVAAVYGANASGKSNLHLAMWYFQRIIAKSFDNVDHDKKAAIAENYFPFSFEKEEENSEFQIIEIIGNFEYRYGFEYNDKCIVTEWLYRKSITTNRTVTIFERTTDSVRFGASVKKECGVYQEQIPPETLVLSFFNKLKMQTSIFRNVYKEIMKICILTTDICEDTWLFNRLLPTIIDDKNSKEKLIEFLTAIDSGIKDIEYDDGEKEIVYYTTHVGRDQEEYLLNLDNESDGTLKTIIIYLYVQMAIVRKGVVFVDELNTKLHPLLLKFIIDLFYGDHVSAQLIYTTHDTTLMDKKFFRRDQIWFVQKDEYGYSQLTALSDFKVRSDVSFEKDYLAGVYGGIPLLKEFQMREGE
ncbi:MAG: ATP-binding protein [Hungatella sp.]|nr:ATP-binding protein [Hungatella sp.]